MRGGLRLAMPAETIRIGQLVLHTEPDMAVVSCFEPVNSPCPIQRFCVLQTALAKACTTFIEVLDGYTLRDLVKPRTSLRNLLSITTDGHVPPPTGPRRAKRANVK
jgi:Rrf2 family nitric oxide-sensitive transcriptional repressor